MYLREEAPNLVVGEGVEIADDVRFGANVVVRPGTRIAAGCLIEDNAVVGKTPRLAKHSSADRSELGPLEIGEGVTVCCGAVVFAGTKLGARTIVGDQALVRERTVVGADTVIGRASGVDNDVTIGDRVRIQSSVYVTAFSTIADDAFLGPCSMTTNDDTMGRHPKGEPLKGVHIGRAARVGGGVVIVPGISLGEEAFIAAGAIVTRDVPYRGVVMGVPGSMVREVPEQDLLERWR